MDTSAIEGKTTNNSTEVVKTAIPAVLVEKEGSSEDAGNKAKLDQIGDDSDEFMDYLKELADGFEEFMPNDQYDQVGQDIIDYYFGLGLGLIDNVVVDQGKELDAAPENEAKKEEEENEKENIDVANRTEDVHERRSSTDENDNAAPENEAKKEQEDNEKENIDVANRIEDVHERRSSTEEKDNEAPENEAKKEQEENEKENIDVANRAEDVHERRSSTDENDNAAPENEGKKEQEENEKENIDVANRTEDVHERGSSTDENDISRVVSVSKQRRPKRKHVEMKRLETRLKGTEPSRPKRRRG
ncbi:hypothetical protein ACFE04_008084 [Oxalis oulophora]